MSFFDSEITDRRIVKKKSNSHVPSRTLRGGGKSAKTVKVKDVLLALIPNKAGIESGKKKFPCTMCLVVDQIVKSKDFKYPAFVAIAYDEHNDPVYWVWWSDMLNNVWIRNRWSTDLKVLKKLKKYKSIEKIPSQLAEELSWVEEFYYMYFKTFGLEGDSFAMKKNVKIDKKKTQYFIKYSFFL